VGDALFPVIRDSFERCVGKYGLRFRSAADVGCGTGRFLHYLLRYRVPLLGVDASAQMLGIAARRLRGSGTRLLRQDIRQLRLPHAVDLITCNGDMLNHLLSEADLRKALQGCADNLGPGGHLVCDFLSGVPRRGTCAAPVRVNMPGVVSLWRCKADPHRRLTQVLVSIGWSTARGWRWQRERHLQRWHSVGRVLAALGRASLEPRGVWRLGAGRSGGTVAWVKLVARREMDDYTGSAAIRGW
jgi:SAM-dependent methyltransferase